MDSAELVSQATAELYGCDPAEFTRRRADLATQARAAGDRAAAKQIADLRKPTRSAWAVNQLVRANPTAPSQLAALAAEFKAGQAAADGAALRRLSQRRRTLIDSLVRQALEIAAEDQPSATLREEVTTMLASALTDPDAASRLSAGALTRAEQPAGFGSLAGGPAQPPPARQLGADDALRAPDTATTQAELAQAERERTGRERAGRERAERERASHQRQRAIADAEQATQDAAEAVDAAAAAERDQEQAIQRLEEQLAQARLRLQQARLRTRQATSAHSNAARALRRLQGAFHDHEGSGAAGDAFPS